MEYFCNFAKSWAVAAVAVNSWRHTTLCTDLNWYVWSLVSLQNVRMTRTRIVFALSYQSYRRVFVLFLFFIASSFAWCRCRYSRTRTYVSVCLFIFALAFGVMPHCIVYLLARQIVRILLCAMYAPRVMTESTYGYGIDFVGRKLKYDKNDVRSIWWAAICCFAVRAKCARHTQLRNRLHLNSRWVSGCRGSFRNRQIIRWSPFKIKLWMRRSADTFVHVRQSRMTMSSKFSFVHFVQSRRTMDGVKWFHFSIITYSWSDRLQIDVSIGNKETAYNGYVVSEQAPEMHARISHWRWELDQKICAILLCNFSFLFFLSVTIVDFFRCRENCVFSSFLSSAPCSMFIQSSRSQYLLDNGIHD